MDYLKELPLGFGMALLQNPASARYFESLDVNRQKQILESTHQIQSRASMQAFVARLPQQTIF